MGCHCDKKEFILQVNGQDRRLAGLEECVFGTVISFPADDAEAAEMMWEQAGFCNDLKESEKDLLLPGLLEFYQKNKEGFSLTSSNCSGCEECC